MPRTFELEPLVWHEPKPKRHRYTIVIGVVLGIVFLGIAVLAYFMWCEFFGSTFAYCLCGRYTHQSSDMQTCEPSYNYDHTTMNCGTRMGYWQCSTLSTCGKDVGWSNCVFEKSSTNRTAIPTCDLYTAGRMICYEATKKCCWFKN